GDLGDVGQARAREPLAAEHVRRGIQDPLAGTRGPGAGGLGVLTARGFSRHESILAGEVTVRGAPWDVARTGTPRWPRCRRSRLVSICRCSRRAGPAKHCGEIKVY